MRNTRDTGWKRRPGKVLGMTATVTTTATTSTTTTATTTTGTHRI
ncbi:hypothetical protein ACFVVX_24590 [Kitasatospora sp. NPDC058170]